MALLTRLGAPFFVVLGLAAVAAAEEAPRVGEVVQVAPKVEGRLGERTAELKPQEPVYVDMEIETHRRAGARLSLSAGSRKGGLVLGSRTILQCTRYVVDLALGREEMSWLARLGQFRMFFDPPVEGAPLREGEYLIETPTARIRLLGTDLVVQVDKDGTTTVWVIEGEVEVTGKAGAELRVPAGSGTRVRPGRAPEPPRRFDRAGNPSEPGPPAHPEETIFPDPPRLDLVSLDLPGNQCF